MLEGKPFGHAKKENMDTTQKTPNREFAEGSHKGLVREAEAWSVRGLDVEIAQSPVDLAAARILEGAAKRRHQKEMMPETEAAYEDRRAETERLRRDEVGLSGVGLEAHHYHSQIEEISCTVRPKPGKEKP